MFLAVVDVITGSPHANSHHPNGKEVVSGMGASRPRSPSEPSPLEAPPKKVVKSNHEEALPVPDLMEVVMSATGVQPLTMETHSNETWKTPTFQGFQQGSRASDSPFRMSSIPFSPYKDDTSPSTVDCPISPETEPFQEKIEDLVKQFETMKTQISELETYKKESVNLKNEVETLKSTNLELQQKVTAVESAMAQLLSIHEEQAQEMKQWSNEVADLTMEVTMSKQAATENMLAQNQWTEVTDSRTKKEETQAKKSLQKLGDMEKSVETMKESLEGTKKTVKELSKIQGVIQEDLKKTQEDMRAVKTQHTSYAAAVGTPNKQKDNEAKEDGSSEVALLMKRVHKMEKQHHLRTFKMVLDHDVPIPREREAQVKLVEKNLSNIGIKNTYIVSSFSVKEKKGGFSIIFSVSSDTEAALIVKLRNFRDLDGQPYMRLYDQLSTEEMNSKKLLYPLHYENERKKKISDGKGGLRNQVVRWKREKMYVEGKEFIIPSKSLPK